MMPIAWAPIYLAVSFILVFVTTMINREVGCLPGCKSGVESRGVKWGCSW